MSIATVKVALPAQFTEKRMLTCDGCGTTTEVSIIVGGPLSNRETVLGWFRGGVAAPDKEGGVELVDPADFCPDCWPKVQAVQQQEAKSIVADKVASAAQVSGVTA